MRRALLFLVLLGAAPVTEQRRLADAKREARLASARAEALSAAAASEQDAARRARDEEAALATQVTAAAARVRAAEARVTLVAQAQSAQNARLAAAQTPVARLLSALTGLARRPTIAVVAQPGSVDDLLHIRAVLGTALPAVRARTQGVRAELARTRRLQAGALLAAAALRDGRAELEGRRIALARLEARHRGQARAYGDGAMTESDRALALGERARDLVDRLAAQGEGRATATELADLPGPLPRPLAPGTMPPGLATGVYRLPVTGSLLTGFGEVSPSGVRSRGLTFGVAPRAVVVAPAGGVVRYANRFRGFGTIVVIDHGAGWTSLITGLSVSRVRPGMRVTAGAVLGRAPAGEEPEITVELRRRGRPADIAALLG